jgi:hypothetical protein
MTSVPIHALAFCAHVPNAKKRLLAMLAIYVDESGGIDTPVFSMGGFVSDETQWKRFDREWRKMLMEFRIRGMHMNELSHSQGEFKGWSKHKKDALMHRAVFIIKSRILFPVGTALSMQNYLEIVPVDIRNKLGDPYYLCLRSLILSMMEQCRRHSIRERVSFVFDRKAKFSKRAVEIYNNFKEADELSVEEKGILGSSSFDDDIDITPLQAADVLAYELNKYHRGHVRGSLKALDEIRGAYWFWDSERLCGWTKEARKVIPFSAQAS